MARFPSFGRMLKTRLKRIGLMAAALPLVAAPAIGADGDVLFQYVLQGPGQSVVIRAIVEGGTCPLVEVDGRPSAMDVRASATQAFPVLVCDRVLQTRAGAVSIRGASLPMPPDGPAARIALMGDTGCRLKAKKPAQGCNDPELWPFAKISASAAVQKPQYVLHVGDYIYREMACPSGNTQCEGSPFGDNWETWRADFFQPAAPLLRAAPWITVRGDHELCAREGGGYFRFLDPRPYSAQCSDATDGYTMDLNGLTLVNLDSAGGVSKSVKQSFFNTQFSSAKPNAAQDSWLITHMPVWALEPRGSAAKPKVRELTPALAAASKTLPEGFTKIVSGHIHLFQLVSLASKPTQIVVGMGGTSLEPEVQSRFFQRSMHKMKIKYGTSSAQFGFAIIDRTNAAKTWRMDVFDANGANQFTCDSNGAAMECAR